MDPRQQQPTSPQTPTQPQQAPGGYAQQPQMPTEQQPVAPVEPQVNAPVSDIAQKKGIKLPVILMVWPAALIVTMMLLSFLVNATTGSAEDGLFGDSGPVQTMTNVLVFATGGIAIFFGPISFIIGLVLLIVRKTSK